MKVGFSVVSRGKDVEFQLFGPPCTDQPSLVTFFQAFDHIAVLMGRLYYRRELLADLDSRLVAERFKECESNDAALALFAYFQFGLKGLERLEGDFALVIWDAKAGCLVGARDPMGGYPLFWTKHADVIALSTSLYPLLTLLPRRSLDLDYLAEYLTLSAPTMELPIERCAYEGVHRLQAGTTICMHTLAGNVEQRVYWNWLERLVDSGTDQMEEISEHYGNLVRHAVRERICGRTTSHLSGGMDSTSVAVIAHNLISSGVGEAPLHALSLVYEQLPGLTGELPYIEGVLQQHKGIVGHRIPADDVLDFDIFAAPPPHDEPFAGLNRLALDRATIDAAVQCGATTMLTGIGSDEMMVMNPFHITDLLRRGLLGSAWTEARKWARVDNCSPWNILYPYGVANILPGWSRGGMEALLRRGYAAWKNQNEWTIAPWIAPSFARQYAMRSRALESAHETFNLCQPTTLSCALASIRSRIGDVDRWSIAAPQGLAIAHPFLDARVLCFGLGIQAKFKPKPEGQKPILAWAMRDVLPENIRNRRSKADFSKIYYLGLARNLQSLEVMIRQAPIDEVGLLDKDILIQCLHQAALGLAKGVGGLHRLNLTLSFIKWFCMQSEWQRTVGSPSKIIRVRPEDGAS